MRYIATLDIFSQGRVIAGLGLGWSKDEFQVSNIPFENKGQRAEKFKALKSIWTGDDDDVEFKGKFYNIPPSKIGPKPFQKPHIPIYLGGHTAKTFSRIVNFDANGWMGYVERPLELLADDIKQLKDKAKSANKDPNQFKIIFGSSPTIVDSGSSTNKTSNEGHRFPLTGTIEEIGADLRKIKNIGVDHIILNFVFSPLGKDISRTIDVSKELLKFVR